MFVQAMGTSRRHSSDLSVRRPTLELRRRINIGQPFRWRPISLFISAPALVTLADRAPGGARRWPRGWQ
jgi:hypothetical protein